MFLAFSEAPDLEKCRYEVSFIVASSWPLHDGVQRCDLMKAVFIHSNPGVDS